MCFGWFPFRLISMTNMTSTERNGVVESWDPNLKRKPEQRRSFLPRKLLRGWLRRSFLYFVVLRMLFSLCFLMLLSFNYCLYKNICYSHELEYFVKISCRLSQFLNPKIYFFLVADFFRILYEGTACGCSCIQFLIFDIFVFDSLWL